MASSLNVLDSGDLPVAIWEGTFTIFGVPLQCFTLNNGQRIIDAGDFARLMDVMNGPSNDVEVGDLAALTAWRMGVGNGEHAAPASERAPSEEMR